jgi:hypothetical protein
VSAYDPTSERAAIAQMNREARIKEKEELREFKAEWRTWTREEKRAYREAKQAERRALRGR